MAATELDLTDFQIPLRSLARPVKTHFRSSLSSMADDDFSDGSSSSDWAHFLPSSSPRDSVFSMPSSSSEKLPEETEKSAGDITLNGSGIDPDLEDLENVQICTITDIVVICLVHLENDTKTLGCVTP